MKFFLYFTLVVGLYTASAQYKTNNGKIEFNASTPLEDIYAINEKVNAIVDIERGQFAAILLIEDFSFERRLMQEHFNENYLESEKYPKASFIGTLKDFDINQLSAVPSRYALEGKLAIHGKAKTFRQDVEILKDSKGNLILKSTFVLRPADFNIKIPKLVYKKIAEEVEVKVYLILKNKAA